METNQFWLHHPMVTSEQLPWNKIGHFGEGVCFLVTVIENQFLRSKTLPWWRFAMQPPLPPQEDTLVLLTRLIHPSCSIAGASQLPVCCFAGSRSTRSSSSSRLGRRCRGRPGRGPGGPAKPGGSGRGRCPAAWGQQRVNCPFGSQARH